MIKKITLIALISFTLHTAFSQVVVNEIQQSNISTLQDNYGEYPDWFELYNTGTTTVNLGDYTATDNLLKTERWQFPSIDLGAGEFITIYASSNNSFDYIDHWESPVLETDTWSYTIPTAATSTNWRETSFDDAAWSTGQGGFGYADDDDNTLITDPSTSIFLRKKFTLADTAEIYSGVFHIDYDDGFVAYLNGTEIARDNIVGDFPAYNDVSIDDREAEVYDGGDYAEYELNTDFIKSILVEGENVLAIQVHNKSATSSDLSARPYLSIALKTNNTYWSPTPSFFTPEASSIFIHTDFSFNNGEEALYLINQGFIEQRIENLPNTPVDYSYGRVTDGTGDFKILSPATPNSSNNSSTPYEGVIADIPTFSLAAGFYIGTQSLSLTTTVSGADIRYTTDGSKPTATSTKYTGYPRFGNSK